MDWKTYYQERHLTADEAVKHIKSGNRVLVGHACGEPSFLLDTMIGHKEDYENVEIVHMVAMGKCEYCQPGMEKHFHHNAYFVGARTRDAREPSILVRFPCRAHFQIRESQAT